MQCLAMPLLQFVIILLMSQRHPLLHHLFPALGVHADPHRIAWRHGIFPKDFSQMMKQSDRGIQKIIGCNLLLPIRIR